MISLVESTSISFGLDAWTSTTSSFHWGDTSANSPSTSHALLSDLLLPSTSAEPLHDQLVMTLSNTGHWATGSSGGSLCSSSLDWVWVQTRSEPQWALRSGAQHLMDCASTTDQPFPFISNAFWSPVSSRLRWWPFALCIHIHPSDHSQWVKSSSFTKIDDEQRAHHVNLKHQSNSSKDKAQALGSILDQYQVWSPM